MCYRKKKRIHMTILTKQYINDHCANLNIPRENLTEFNIPDDVTSISQYAFMNCASLESITIPDNVTSIGEHAFQYCESLTSITIPHGVTKINTWTFFECTSLTSITIPDSVTEIGAGAFYRCTWLRQIICNNPDLFTDQHIRNRDQIQFISAANYFNNNFQELLIAIGSSGFNSYHVSSEELNLIIKLHQEDFHPNWNSIVTTFNERSMDQIQSILHYFNKTSCLPRNIEKPTLLKITGKVPATINDVSMFLNLIEYTNLSMTAENITLRSK